MDVLERHQLKGVFFVEALSACKVGPEPLRKLVRDIQDRGHEVQLHLHTEWLDWITEPILPGRRGQNLKDFSEEEQVVLLRRGLENLRASGASYICAFRAGNYGANVDTLRGLHALGIPFDTSYNFTYLDKTCGMRLPDVLLQPRRVGYT